jgi:DNA repair protein RadC
MSLSIPLYHLELVRDRSVPFKSLATTEQAAEVFHDLLDRSPVEQMAVIHLDPSSKMVGVEKVGLGTVTMVMVTMAEVFRGAIAASVPFIILGHNHPSDDPTPSGPDWNLTDKARIVGRDLGIEVIDHIVVSPNGKHVSMKAEDFKQQDDLLGSLMSMADLLPPEERRMLEDKMRMMGIDPKSLPRKDLGMGDLPPLPRLPGRMPPIGTNLGDLLRKKLGGR